MLVSCIVPVYNGARFLAQALDSIQAQGHRPLETIVVDDGSEDDTAAIATSYRPEVRYLFQPNAGAPSARNLGLSVAGGEFVAFLDADDLWHPEKLIRQLARFAARPELDYVVSHIQNAWEGEGNPEAERWKDHPRSRPLPGYVTGALLARRSLFQRVGGFDGGIRHADSAEWFLRVRAAGGLGELMPDLLVTRRMHQENTSRRSAEQSRAEFFRLIKRHLDRSRGSHSPRDPSG